MDVEAIQMEDAFAKSGVMVRQNNTWNGVYRKHRTVFGYYKEWTNQTWVILFMDKNGLSSTLIDSYSSRVSVGIFLRLIEKGSP